MTNTDLLEEIRLNRRATEKNTEKLATLHSDFYLFKGKSLGFIAVLSIVINISIAYFIKG